MSNNTESSTTRFTCYGSARGWCGVRHRSEEAAERHCASDNRECNVVGGYSDRRVWAVSDMAERADGSLYR